MSRTTSTPIRRAYLHYGIQLSLSDLRNMVKQIQDGRGRLVRRQSAWVTIWDVGVVVPCGTLASALCLDPEPALVYPAVKSRTIRVVYDKKNKCIASVIPHDA